MNKEANLDLAGLRYDLTIDNELTTEKLREHLLTLINIVESFNRDYDED